MQERFRAYVVSRRDSDFVIADVAGETWQEARDVLLFHLRLNYNDRRAWVRQETQAALRAVNRWMVGSMFKHTVDEVDHILWFGTESDYRP